MGCNFWNEQAKRCENPTLDEVEILKQENLELKDKLQTLNNTNQILQEIIVKMCYEKYMKE